jgi:hypothetical protein
MLMKKGYPFQITSAEIVELIEVREFWGTGTEEDPRREVVMHFTKQGSLQAIHDPEHPHNVCYTINPRECDGLRPAKVQQPRDQPVPGRDTRAAGCPK